MDNAPLVIWLALALITIIGLLFNEWESLVIWLALFLITWLLTYKD